MIYVTIVVGIVVLECLLKGYIEKNMNEGAIEKKCDGFLWIRKYHNRGAFLNILEKNRVLIRVISILFSLLITAFFVVTLGKKGNVLLKTGLALLLGGAFSNTYDRLHREYVVDYFSIHIPKGPLEKLSKVVFNIADFCIMIGAMLTVIALKD